MADEELKTPYVNTFLDKRDFCKEQIQEKKKTLLFGVKFVANTSMIS